MKNFVLPEYDGSSIVNLSSTILKKFNVENSTNPLKMELELNNRIILILIDGLGSNMLNNSGFGSLSIANLTSVFPSTTSTAISSILTASTPGEHGLLGYISYFKELGGLTNILRYSHPLSSERDMFKDFMDLKEITNAQNIFKKMTEKGIRSKIIIPRDISNSALSRLLHEGAEVQEYIMHWDGLILLKKIMNESVDFVYAYYPHIDTLSHIYGPNSEEVKFATIELIKNILEISKEKPKDVSIIITADHGHIEVGKVYKIIEDQELMKLISMPPFGDSRAIFLKTKMKIDEIFSKKYNNFLLLTQEEAIKLKLFGNFNENYIDRIGDYIAIPKDNSIMIYPFRKGDERMLKSQHGGLLEEEMLVPLILL